MNGNIGHKVINEIEKNIHTNLVDGVKNTD